jgi:hypothetical protein
MLSPIGAVPIHPLSSERIIVMDGLFTYDSSYIKDIFNKLGADGMEIYRTFHVFDSVFALSYCLLAMALLKPFTPKKAKWMWIVFPVLPTFFDCMENLVIEIASLQFPMISQRVATLAAVFSSMKWCALGLWFSVFLVMIIRQFVAKKMLRRSN